MAEECFNSVEQMTMEDDKGAGDQDDIVNPWDVQSTSATGVDYDKLISK
jgi:hypothetical protein